MLYLKNIETPQPIFIPKDEDTGAVPSGKGVLQSKSWEITENGATIVSPDPGYDGISGGTITVYVSGGGGGETEFKHLTATENGEYPATGNTAFSGVTVDVQPNNQSKTALFTQNGTQVITFDAGYSGLQEVEVVVNLPSDIVNQTKNVLITGNTAVTLTYDQGYTGLESVGIIVNVPDNKQSKSLNITANTATTITYDQGYTGLEQVSVSVDVPDPEQTALTATTNGDYTPSGYYGYSAVTVSVPGPETTSLTATTNGNYTPTGFDGYSAVTVDVPGIHNQDKSVTISEDMGQGTNFISASTVVTADTGYTGLGEVQVDVAIPCINSQAFSTPITANGTYYIGMDVPEQQVPQLVADRPARQFAFTVQVTPRLATLDATNNNTTYLPSSFGADGFSQVTTHINTEPYYISGYTEGWQDGYNGVVTSWDQVSGATSLVYTSMTIGERWSLSKLKGVYSADTTYDGYPYYAESGGALAHLGSATTIYQEMPAAENLKNFFKNCNNNCDVTILGSSNLSSLEDGFSYGYARLLRLETTTSAETDTARVFGCSFANAFFRNWRMPSAPQITGWTNYAPAMFYESVGLTDLSGVDIFRYTDAQYLEQVSFNAPTVVESICWGCSTLHTIPEWNWIGVTRVLTGQYEAEFAGCTALSTLGGFKGLGTCFRTAENGYHTLSFVDCTNPYDSTAVTQSLTNVISKLGTVPAEVTDATVLINSTWAGIIGASTLSALQTVAAGKNWQVTVA